MSADRFSPAWSNSSGDSRSDVLLDTSESELTHESTDRSTGQSDQLGDGSSDESGHGSSDGSKAGSTIGATEKILQPSSPNQSSGQKPGTGQNEKNADLNAQRSLGYRLWATLGGAIVFYTVLPWPRSWSVTFEGIARLIPAIGLGLGLALASIDAVMTDLGMPPLTRSGLLVLMWIWFTGGLHLDGAMDSADGLAVTDRDRRLAVMADSATGAFGAMAAIAIILLKTLALSEQALPTWLVLPAVAGWGRWAQVVVIVRYPYLKPQGKGAMHKTVLQSDWEILPGLILLLGLAGMGIMYFPDRWAAMLAMTGLGSTIAISVGAWFHWQLGGHTGDTYGAVVEWTEALMLLGLTLIKW